MWRVKHEIRYFDTLSTVKAMSEMGGGRKETPLTVIVEKSEKNDGVSLSLLVSIETGHVINNVTENLLNLLIFMRCCTKYFGRDLCERHCIRANIFFFMIIWIFRLKKIKDERWVLKFMSSLITKYRFLTYLTEHSCLQIELESRMTITDDFLYLSQTNFK